MIYIIQSWQDGMERIVSPIWSPCTPHAERSVPAGGKQVAGRDRSAVVWWSSGRRRGGWRIAARGV